MGLNSENVVDLQIVCDIETTCLSNAADYLEPVQPARNLKDPEKIKADIEQRTAERDSKLALDWNVGRVAALGTWTERAGTQVAVCANEQQEAIALTCFWLDCRYKTIVGFNIKGFDLKFMIQRSRYLGIDYPLLTDFHPKGATAQKYGVFLEERGLAGRAVIVVDKQGKVRHIDWTPNTEIPDEAAALACVRGL